MLPNLLGTGRRGRRGAEDLGLVDHQHHGIAVLDLDPLTPAPLEDDSATN